MVKLNGMFEKAQETADNYLFNVKEKCKKIENDTKKECQVKMEKMIKETEDKCRKKEEVALDRVNKLKLEIKELNTSIKKIKKNNVSSKKEKNKSIGKKTLNSSVDKRVVVYE